MGKLREMHNFRCRICNVAYEIVFNIVTVKVNFHLWELCFLVQATYSFPGPFKFQLLDWVLTLCFSMGVNKMPGNIQTTARVKYTLYLSQENLCFVHSGCFRLLWDPKFIFIQFSINWWEFPRTPPPSHPSCAGSLKNNYPCNIWNFRKLFYGKNHWLLQMWCSGEPRYVSEGFHIRAVSFRLIPSFPLLIIRTNFIAIYVLFAGNCFVPNLSHYVTIKSIFMDAPYTSSSGVLKFSCFHGATSYINC